MLKWYWQIAQKNKCNKHNKEKRGKSTNDLNNEKEIKQ